MGGVNVVGAAAGILAGVADSWKKYSARCRFVPVPFD